MRAALTSTCRRLSVTPPSVISAFGARAVLYTSFESGFYSERSRVGEFSILSTPLFADTSLSAQGFIDMLWLEHELHAIARAVRATAWAQGGHAESTMLPTRTCALPVS